MYLLDSWHVYKNVRTVRPQSCHVFSGFSTSNYIRVWFRVDIEQGRIQPFSKGEAKKGQNSSFECDIPVRCFIALSSVLKGGKTTFPSNP